MGSTPIFDELCREHTEAGKACPVEDPLPAVIVPDRGGDAPMEQHDAPMVQEDEPQWVAPERVVA